MLNGLLKDTINDIETQTIFIGANRKLKLIDAKNLLRKHISVELSAESYPRMENSYTFLKSCIDKRIFIYGINTQFGDQVNLLDPALNQAEETTYYNLINARQESAIKYLACGLGKVVSADVVKIAMALRAHCLAQGYSGVSLRTVEAILAYLNAGIFPIVREYGSIGASGDLIPLAMIAAGIIGEEIDVQYQGKIMQSHQAIEMAGLQKFKPYLRDGLALINGTSFMTAIAALAVYDLNRLFKQMLSAIAMSLEAMLVISSAYHPLVHQLKHHKGEMLVNQFLIDFWQGSQLLTQLTVVRKIEQTSQDTKESRPLQDYYSLRAVSQGFGPFWENLERSSEWVENEMNSVNDNPIIAAKDNEIYQGANFMGYYITDACDILKMNIAQASTWLHALLSNMLHPRKNHHLPANLVEEPHKNNGFRGLQLLTAALTIQNRKLAQSQQAFMLPTEGDNQDVNSLGTHAAFDLREAVTNLERITAILLLAATQGLEMRGIEKASVKSQFIYNVIRKHSPTLTSCRVMQKEISSIVNLLKKEKLDST